MGELIWLAEAQMRKIGLYSPLPYEIPRVDDRWIVSAIIYVIKHGLMWPDGPKANGPHKTIYNRFIRWRRPGVFNRIFVELAGKAGEPDKIMIDATDLKVHRTAASLLKRGSSSSMYRATNPVLIENRNASYPSLGCR